MGALWGWGSTSPSARSTPGMCMGRGGSADVGASRHPQQSCRIVEPLMLGMICRIQSNHSPVSTWLLMGLLGREKVFRAIHSDRQPIPLVEL